MKPKNIIQTLLLFVFLLGVDLGYAQQEVYGLKQVFDIHLDELGNATISMTSKLNAQQWGVYQQNMGGNSASLKREIEKSMPKYHLSDFEYSEEPLERTFTIKMKATAVAKTDKNGKWKSEFDSKNPDIMKVNELQYRLDANYISGGQLLDQTTHIYLPKGAKESKIENDSFGNAVLTYKLKLESSSGGSWLSIFGVLFIIGGGVLWWKKPKQ